MPMPAQYRLVDRIFDGTLKANLLAWRAEGLSLTAIALRLHDDHSVDVTGETVRRWLIALADADALQEVAG